MSCSHLSSCSRLPASPIPCCPPHPMEGSVSKGPAGAPAGGQPRPEGHQHRHNGADSEGLRAHARAAQHHRRVPRHRPLTVDRCSSSAWGRCVRSPALPSDPLRVLPTVNALATLTPPKCVGWAVRSAGPGLTLTYLPLRSSSSCCPATAFIKR